ncbi:L,D-transpeptidase [Phyllobacterium salinisoli]|uniref:L,D-transpeptidase n=1 Tax=Phyllobacterium salinisoli TaxID=1899321 RepID=A0A368K7L0_9HYPH|nr:L,D-transpeptidase [Phyllobacterium salinisoli]RCS24625.1 L,D-transpeptidase [Phyllobacterium salinisoli]
MKPRHLLLITAVTAITISAISATGAWASDRYATRPPVVMSPDLAAPWVMQLEQPRYYYPAPSFTPQRYYAPSQKTRRVAVRRAPGMRSTPGMRGTPGMAADQPPRYREVTYRRPAQRAVRRSEDRPQRQMNPIYLPQTVDYDGPHKPGTIVVDTARKFLYLVGPNGKARRYGVGVGKEGFGWRGTNPITRKAEWPDWRPPAEMIARERKNGRVLPVHMEGGPANPLGARALYLGSTLYRIHGTNAPWTIGTAASSGCIRMRNEDVTDLYERVKIGTKVVVM